MLTMVINPDLPPSRAGALPMVGGDLALDFANTESGRGFASHQNHLRNATNVLEWLSHANALPPETSERLRDAVARDAELAEDIFATATALRSATHLVGVAIGRGSVPPEAPLA